MFKEGDRIKCLVNDNYDFQLDLNESYIFVKYFGYDNFGKDNYIVIKGYEDILYMAERFELDKKYYRKEKLKFLNNDA